MTYNYYNGTLPLGNLRCPIFKRHQGLTFFHSHTLSQLIYLRIFALQSGHHDLFSFYFETKELFLNSHQQMYIAFVFGLAKTG